LPSHQSPTCIGSRISGSAFQPNLRLFIGYRVLRLHLPVDLRFSSAINLPALPSARPSSLRRTSHLRALPSVAVSDFHRNLPPPALSATNLRSQSEFESSGGAVDLQPTCVGL
jgi:hypothetical protein